MPTTHYNLRSGSVCLLIPILQVTVLRNGNHTVGLPEIFLGCFSCTAKLYEMCFVYGVWFNIPVNSYGLVETSVNLGTTLEMFKIANCTCKMPSLLHPLSENGMLFLKLLSRKSIIQD